MVNPLKTTKEEKGNNSTHNEGELISKIYHIKADDKKAEDVVSSEKEKKIKEKGYFSLIIEILVLFYLISSIY